MIQCEFKYKSKIFCYNIFNMLPTYRPNVRRRKKTIGFRARMKTKAGRKVLKNRRKKGRWNLIPD